MKFNKVARGARREMNDAKSIYSILDAGFLCHVAFQNETQTMMIPTAYGREGTHLYLHGSAKNQMLNHITTGQTVCIAVTHLDGIVLAKTLFDTSVNYRSAILFGKAENVLDETEKLHGLKIITENILKGRWDEVKVGDENQLKATLVVRFTIESASAKIRSGDPAGDDNIEEKVWSGQIPLTLKAMTPIQDMKFGQELELSNSVINYFEKNK